MREPSKALSEKCTASIALNSRGRSEISRLQIAGNAAAIRDVLSTVCATAAKPTHSDS